jgi:hypothetical protein
MKTSFGPLADFEKQVHDNVETELNMGNMPQELHPIENIFVLSKMSVQSSLSWGTYF